MSSGICRWFDHWLRERGDALASLPGYLFYVIGEGRWLTRNRGRLSVRLQRWYLDSAGHAQSAAGDGALTLLRRRRRARQLSLRPRRPGAVARRAGVLYRQPSDPQGPAEQRDVEARRDVLVHTSLRSNGRFDRRAAARQADGVVLGSRHRLRRSPGARLAGWPLDQHPGGCAACAYRDGPGRPSLMTPGQTYTVEIAMRSIAYYLPAGIDCVCT